MSTKTFELFEDGVSVWKRVITISNSQPTKYTLAIVIDQPGWGSISLSPTSPYDLGTQVTATAIPSQGYKFSKWSGDVTSLLNPLSGPINKNMSITASFVKINQQPDLTGATQLSWNGQISVGVMPGSDTLFVATVPEGDHQLMKIDLFGTSEEMVADTEWTYPDGHTRSWSIRGSNVGDRIQLFPSDIPAGNYYVRLKGVVGGGVIIRTILV